MTSDLVVFGQFNDFAGINIDANDDEMKMHVIRIGVDRANDGAIADAKSLHEDFNGLLEITEKVIALLHTYDDVLDDTVASIRLLHKGGHLGRHQIRIIGQDIAYERRCYLFLMLVTPNVT